MICVIENSFGTIGSVKIVLSVCDLKLWKVSDSLYGNWRFVFDGETGVEKLMSN
jgi:hypothetical protein